MPTIVDDARLAELAVGRPKDLFPVLDRTASLMPLLAVLTILPGLIALQFASIEESDARWRLRALEMSAATTVLDALGESPQPASAALRWQPPLGSWLSAAAVYLPGPLRARGSEIVEFLSVACLVPLSYLLVSQQFGSRIGFLAAAILAFHSTLLLQYQNAAPHALAVGTAMIAFWGYLGHLHNPDEMVSVNLLVGGVGLGLCLLAGGPLALLVLAILLLYALSLRSVEPAHSSRAGRFRNELASERWPGLAALRALFVMAVTAFATGGWWVLMMLYNYGTTFIAGWLHGRIANPLAGLGPEESAAPFDALLLSRELFSTMGLLSGLLVVGVAMVGVGLFSRRGEDQTNLRFLAAWSGLALAAFSLALRDQSAESLNLEMWRLFLASAFITCAAVGIDEVAHRRVSLFLFAATTIATLVAGYGILQQNESGHRISIAALLAGLIVAVVFAGLLQRMCSAGEWRRRVLLIGLICACWGADVWTGIGSIRTNDPDYRALAHFRRSLPTGIEPEMCVVISETSVPLRLQFALKSVWPKAELSVVDDWDKALKRVLGETSSPRPGVVIVDWTIGDSRSANPTGDRWESQPMGNPQFFEQRQLRAYLGVDRAPELAGVVGRAEP